MKLVVILFTFMFPLGIVSGAMDRYDPYQRDEAKREKALEEKAQQSSLRRRLMRYEEELKELKAKIESLNQQVEKKDQLISKYATDIIELTNKIRELEAMTDVIVYSKPFFDIYLGELVKHLDNRIGLTNESGALKYPPGTFVTKTTRNELKRLLVRTHKYRVYEIAASYKDISKENFETIKNELEKNFKPAEKADHSMIATDGIVYACNIDGITVFIVLERIKNMQGESLNLRCIHKSLINEVNLIEH